MVNDQRGQAMTDAPEHLWIKWTQADADTPPSMMSAHPSVCVASNLDSFYTQGYTPPP